ncbi:MAG: zinc carboxypeptidase, partial [Allomuricauda sp.]
LIQQAQKKFQVPIYAAATGYNAAGIDLGSRYVEPITKPKAALLIGDGVRSYDAGEVWHLLDTRVHMPITKIPMRNFERANLDKYNTLVMGSGNYDLSKKQQEKIKNWVSNGNTLVTIGTASKWAIEKKLVKERLTEKEEDSTKTVVRKPYVDASEYLGRESVGGGIFKVDLDVTHPLAFGYHDTSIPVYKNNSVWLAPSKNEYATVAKYAKNPHIDGFITKKNMEDFLKPSASLIVSKVGSGRVVLFADNPNFRGSWYGTNRLFLNALFLGDKIEIPE